MRRRPRDNLRGQKAIEYLPLDRREARQIFNAPGAQGRLANQALRLANRGLTDPTLQTAEQKSERAEQILKSKRGRGRKRGFTPVLSQRGDGTYHARRNRYSLVPINTRPYAPVPGTNNQYRVTGYGRTLATQPLPIVGIRGTLRDAPPLPNYTLMADILNQSYQRALNAIGNAETPIDTVRHKVQISYEMTQFGNRMTYSRLVPVAEAINELFAMLERDAGYNPGTRVGDLIRDRDFQFQFHLSPVVGKWQNPFEFDEEVYRRRLFFIPPDITIENNLCVFMSALLATRRRNVLGTNNDLHLIKDIPKKPKLEKMQDVLDLIERATTLRSECNIGNHMVGPSELERISDRLGLIIHVLQREAADSEIYRIIPTYARNDTTRMAHLNHIYIYFVQNHCHPIVTPHLFVKGEGSDPRMANGKKDPHLMCDWCLLTFKDKNILKQHIPQCKKTHLNKRKDLVEIRKSLGQKIKCKDFLYQKGSTRTGVKYCRSCKKYLTLGTPEYRFCQKNRHNISNVSMMWCTHCGEKNIREHMIDEHQCFCSVKPRPERPVETLFFWDVESMFPSHSDDIEPYKTFVDKEDRMWEMKKQEHIVNCVVLMNHSGEQVWEFDTIDEFCHFVFDPENNELFSDSLFLAHNGGGYDNHFVNQFLLKNGKKPYLLPTNGSSPTRLICLEFMGRKFIDSLNFIAQPLSTFGKAFGLDITKGYFPYEFNTIQNQGYRGPIPDKSFFGIENSKCGSIQDYAKIKREFDEWYDEEEAKQEEWDLRERLFYYCRLDVDVLRQGCLKFREMCLNLTKGNNEQSEWKLNNIDPFNHLTLSGVVINIALSGFKKKAFAQFPSKPQKKQRSWALAYKDYLEEQGNVFIDVDEDIRNHFTKSYATFQMITPEDMETKENEMSVTQWIHGNCYNVGCPSCYPEDRATHINPFMDETLEDLFNLFQADVAKIQGNDQVLVTFDHDLHTVTERNELLVRAPLLRNVPINPREALFGGRTEPFKLYATGPIYHIDVVSLYPTVCAFDEIPVGLPTHMNDPGEIWDLFVNRKELFGYVRCEVEPPKDLLIPFLPNRREEDGRLVFALEPMTGTWTTVDLYFAMEHGYQIKNVYQATHFEPSERKIGPFKEYVDTFIKIKQKAKAEGNKTMYLISKLFLNSLWGKFVEQPHKSNLSIVVNPSEYYQMMDSPHIETESMRWIEVWDNVWMVRYDFDDKFTKNAKNNNPYLGTFVLSHARRRLHEMMVQIGLDRVIYCDTDSIAYTHDTENEENNPETGEELGEWENEAHGFEQGNFIKEFIGMGPKSYCEVFSKPELQGMDFLLKFKGVRTTEKTFSYLNPDSLRTLVQNYCIDPDADWGIGVDSWTINNRYGSALGRTLGLDRSDPGTGQEGGGGSGDPLLEGGIVNTFTMQNMKVCSVNLTKRMLPERLKEDERDLIKEIQTFPLGYDFGEKTQNEKYSMTYKR